MKLSEMNPKELEKARIESIATGRTKSIPVQGKDVSSKEERQLVCGFCGTLLEDNEMNHLNPACYYRDGT